MHIFTWNVGKRVEMAPRALAYLERAAEQDYVIASLQEWPWEFPDLQGHGLDVVRAGGKALLLYSRELTLGVHGPDASRRATVARLGFPSGREITAVGLHWHSRDSRSGIDGAAARGGAMALFRQHLDAHLVPGIPAILMGDFNASTSEDRQELTSPYCLFARGSTERMRPAMETVMGQDKRAWVLVEPEMPKDAGTFFWQHTQAWSVLDHVVLTPDLEKGLQGAEVLTRMEGHEFLTDEKRVPRGATLASDHLPVVCRIHYE